MGPRPPACQNTATGGYFEALRGIFGWQEFAGRLRKVDQNSPTLKDGHPGLRIDDCRHAVVRTDCEELRSNWSPAPISTRLTS